jgi:hypothetical protein
MSWGAVFAGAVVAVATALLLSLLGASMGAPVNFADASSADASRYGIGAGIWEIVTLALSMALGGYVAARLSGTHSHLDGELHGITMWGLAVLLGSVLLVRAVTGIVGFVGEGASPPVNSATGAAGTALGAVSPDFNQQTMVNLLEGSLLNSGDPTTMSREQIGSEITALVGKSVIGDLSNAEHNRLVSLVAVQSGITREEAARRVTQMENDQQARRAQIAQKASATADALARGAASAARALFAALALGLLAALIGAWIGTRHKRAMHPVVEPGVDVRDTGSGTQFAYDAGRPASVSVYDETGQLVSQYLRGVSFPVSKQDLVQLARSSNARPGVLQLIERMAEGSYTNASQVLSALGMAR